MSAQSDAIRLMRLLGAVTAAAFVGSGCASFSRADGLACETHAFEVTMQQNLIGRPYLKALSLDGRTPSAEDFDMVDREVRRFDRIPDRQFVCDPLPRLEFTGRASGRWRTVAFAIDGGDLRPLPER